MEVAILHKILCYSSPQKLENKLSNNLGISSEINLAHLFLFALNSVNVEIQVLPDGFLPLLFYAVY